VTETLFEYDEYTLKSIRKFCPAVQIHDINPPSETIAREREREREREMEMQ